MKYLKKLSWLSLCSFFSFGVIVSSTSATEEPECDPTNEESVCL